jgi:condensin complex subunit 1
MAEQALNTIYLLGEQPDVLCTAIIHRLHERVFNSASSDGDEPMPEVTEESQQDVTMEGEEKTGQETAAAPTQSTLEKGKGAIELAQLVFVVGHVSIKHIVYLELVEREVKRQKDETSKGEKRVPRTSLTSSNLDISLAANSASKSADKDANDLEAVTGNAEDDIGDLVANVRERELLYGESSLLASYGGLIAHICASPKSYRVSQFLAKRGHGAG